ncbi:MAG: hypothetical protein GY829_14975, partial [Gammaproteobacteria bacterium]|nr:hypothetical protein [Gammaproteobacteria bacterium]
GIKCARRSKDDKKEWASFFTAKGAAGCLITSKPAAAGYAEFQKQTGKSILTPDDIEQIKGMAEAVGKNEYAMTLLNGGLAEQSIYWTDEETGLNCRVRPDYLNHHCTDLKSVQSVRPQFFAKKAYDLGYHISQAMYQDGIYQVTGDFKQFKFLCVEKTPPFLNAVHAFNDESAEEGHKQYRTNLNRLAECLDTGVWPGVDNDEEMSLPAYAFKDEFLGVVLNGVSI